MENYDIESRDSNPFRDVVATLMQSTQTNINEIQSLIYAHEHFAPSEILLQALILFYKANKPSNVSSEADSTSIDVIATRIINFLKNWIKVDKAKFTNPLRDLGKDLAQFRLSLPEVWDTVLKNSLDEGGPVITVDDEDDSEDHIKPNELSIAKLSKSRKSNQPLQLFDFKAKDIAQQLTLIDQHLMKEVDLNELLGSKWTTPGQAPTLEKIAKHSDEFAYWFLYEMIIIKLKNRTKLVIHVIDICGELIKLQNFQSLMNIYLAFQLIPVQKLDLLHDILNNVVYHHSFLIWQEVTALLDYAGNFKAYREKTKQLAIPIVLSQEVLLKDLLYNEEATKNFDKDSKQLNSTKLNTMGAIVVNFSKCRNSCFKIQNNPDLAKFLTNFPVVSREILEQLIDDKTDLYRTLVRYRRGKVTNLLAPEMYLTSDTFSSSQDSTSMSMSISERNSSSNNSKEMKEKSEPAQPRTTTSLKNKKLQFFSSSSK